LICFRELDAIALFVGVDWLKRNLLADHATCALAGKVPGTWRNRLRLNRDVPIDWRNVSPLARGNRASTTPRTFSFDFNTQNSGMLTQMFSFIVQFENTPPEPMFPGSVIRHPGETSRR